MSPPPTATATPVPAVRPRRASGSAAPSRRTLPPRAPRPRRISGPARPARVAPAKNAAPGRRAPAPAARAGTDALLVRRAERLLDRLVRSRAWIALVAFALIGIVAAQLWVVKVGAGIGRALEHEGLLQRENATLAIEDSALASGERIERAAAAAGMEPAQPAALHFDAVRGPLDARLAAAALARPAQPAATSSTTSTAVPAEASASTAEAPAAATSAATSTAVPVEASASTAEAPAAATSAATSTAAPAEASASTTEAPAAPTPTAEAPATAATEAAAGG